MKKCSDSIVRDQFSHSSDEYTLLDQLKSFQKESLEWEKSSTFLWITDHLSFREAKTTSYGAPVNAFTERSEERKELLKGMSSAERKIWLEKNDIRYYAAEDTAGHKLSYNINGSGNSRGTAMVDTRLDGSGNYQTLVAGLDDYRAQEFPNGSPATINTYTFKITQV